MASLSGFMISITVINGLLAINTYISQKYINNLLQSTVQKQIFKLLDFWKRNQRLHVSIIVVKYITIFLPNTRVMSIRVSSWTHWVIVLTVREVVMVRRFHAMVWLFHQSQWRTTATTLHTSVHEYGQFPTVRPQNLCLVAPHSCNNQAPLWLTALPVLRWVRCYWMPHRRHHAAADAWPTTGHKQHHFLLALASHKYSYEDSKWMVHSRLRFPIWIRKIYQVSSSTYNVDTAVFGYTVVQSLIKIFIHSMTFGKPLSLFNTC